jgi:hypothetical protein
MSRKETAARKIGYLVYVLKLGQRSRLAGLDDTRISNIIAGMHM